MQAIRPYSITAPADARLPGGGNYSVSNLLDLNPNKVGQVDNYFTFARNYGKQIDHFNGVDVTVNARMANGLLLTGGVSTGKTITDNCEILAKVPEISPVGVPYCHTDSGMVTQVKAFGAYTFPKIDTQLSATFQSVAGPQVTSNFVASNAQIAPSLGRNLTGATNATINLVAPGEMYGDRLNELDLRIGKPVRFGRLRSVFNLDLYNVFNSDAVLSVNNNYATWLRPQSTITARFLKLSLQMDF